MYAAQYAKGAPVKLACFAKYQYYTRTHSFHGVAAHRQIHVLLADSQAEPLYSNQGKTVSEDSFPDAVKPVNASNDASSGQVKKGSNANPEGAPDATWWLREVNMSVGPGELVCVVGRVGSGKSSLIGALLGKGLRNSCTVVLHCMRSKSKVVTVIHCLWLLCMWLLCM